MKKLLLLLLALVTVITVMAFTSCGHECEYTVEVPEAGTAATCLKSGVKVMKCSECENTKNEIIPALGHDHVSTVVEPTCKTEGYTTQTCSRCGDTNGDAKLDKKPPTGQHTYVAVENSTIQATCTVNGYSVEKCSVCGQEKKVNVIVAPGHNYQEKELYDNEIAPTCTTGSEGVITKRCTVCNEKDPSFTEVPKDFPALGHDIPHADTHRISTVAATCTTAQHDVWKCSRCEYTEEADIGTALGHDYTVDLGVSSPATCSSLEKRNYECSRKGQDGCTGTPAQGPVSKEITIENTYTAHVPGTAATCVDAQVCSTCVAAGKVNLSTTCDKSNPNCTQCSAMNKAHVFEDPTGRHDYKNYDANNEFLGTYKEAQAQSVVAPTCMRQGYTVYSCTVCQGNDFKDNYTAIDPTNHNVDMDNAVGDPIAETCIKHEYTIHACTNTAEDGTTRCDHTEEKVYGTTYADHQFTAGEPTGVITCTYCQKSFYDTTYIESKYNDGETEWDEEETEFDDDTSLNVTITVSKSDKPAMSLTGNEEKEEVNASNPDATKISVIRIVTDDEDATFVITVNGKTIDHTGNGFIDLCEYGDITELKVKSTSLDGDATVYFYGEDPVPDTTNP
ncbi:MAG: hypothetical protein E7622_06920 [Ruminococcaceae bacterium]|nr:hypothetical protein [Oscillospiraceae bacterium]